MLGQLTCNEQTPYSVQLTDFDEEVAHVERGLGGGLEEDDVVLEGVLLRLLRLHLPLALHVRLIARQSYHYVGVASALQLLHPRLGAVERILEGRERLLLSRQWGRLEDMHSELTFFVISYTTIAAAAPL